MHREEKVSIRDCGDDAAEWVSKYLMDQNTGLRLGFYDSTRKRDITQTHAEHLKEYKNLDNTSLVRLSL